MEEKVSYLGGNPKRVGYGHKMLNPLREQYANRQVAPTGPRIECLGKRRETAGIP